MAILYKGYAQQKGFSSYLVDVPDPSEKIRKQGIQAMGHMRDQIEWNNKQSQRVAQALEKNATLEAKQARANFELGSYLNEQKQKWIDKGFDNRIAAEKQKIKARENQIKNLLQITQSGRQIWKAYDAKQTEAATNWAKQGWIEHGIGLKNFRAVQDIEDEIWNDSSAREAALAKMGLEGVDITYLQTIRSASGYKKLAVAKQEARRWALQRPDFYATNENYQFDLEGVGKVNLRDAVGPQVATVLQLLDKKAIDDLKAAGGIEPSSKVMALSQSYQLLENARVQIYNQKAQQSRLEARKAEWHDEWTILDDSFNYTRNGLEEVNVGAGLIRAIEYYAGPNPTAEDYRRAKHRVFRAWEEGIKQGYWPTAKFKNIEDYEFDHSSGRTTIGNIFKKEMLKIEDALVTGAQRESGIAGLHVEQTRTLDLQFLEDLKNFEGNAHAWSMKLNIATERGFNTSRTYISNKLTRMADETADQEVLGIVQSAVDSNRHMTKAEVEELGGSPKATAIAMQMLEQNSQFLPDRYGHNEEIEQRVDRWLETLIPTPLTGAQDPSRSSAKTAAINIARSQYKAFMTKPGATPEAALDHALSYTKERVLKGEDFKPEFDDALGGYVFPIGRIRIGAKELTLDDAAVANIIQKDRSRIYNTPFVSPQALRIKSNNLNKGIQQELLPRSMFVESNAAGMVTALETEQAQIEYYNKILKSKGQPLIRPYPDWYIKRVKQQYNNINPESIRLLNKWDYCKVNQAACQSGMNPTYTRPAFMKVRSVISSTLGTDGNLGWNYTEQGSSTKRDDLKKIHLTNATVGQILALQDKGLIQTAGRYQFTSDGLREAMEASGVSENTKFNADTQNKLFDMYFKKNGLKMINTLENEDQRFLLLNIYESLHTQKLSNLGFNSPNTLSLAAYAELKRRGIYNAA